MSSIDVEDILKRLSNKFNRIFCDREFVCCVNEDLQVILKNKNKCCVVVFPVLGPNYMKAVRYQAKIFDLSVFTLGSDQICSIAVCHKEHLIKKLEESEEQIMPERDQEIGGSKLRKKRPERPLYVPPAQRRLPAHDSTVQNNKPENDNNAKTNKTVYTIRRDTTEKTKRKTSCEDRIEESRTIEEEYYDRNFDEDSLSGICVIGFVEWKYELSETVWNPLYFTKNYSRPHSRKCSLFSCPQKSKVLYLVRNDYCLWQPSLNIRFSGYKGCANIKIIPSMHSEVTSNQCNDNDRRMISILVGPIFEKTFDVVLEDNNVFCDYNVLWIRKEISNDEVFNLFGEFYYLLKNDCYECNDDLIEDIYNYLDTKIELVQIPEIPSKIGCIPYIADNKKTESPINDVLIPSVTEDKNKQNFDSRTISENIGNSEQFNISVQKHYIKNNVTNLCNTNENVKNANELDEEKEIMRKAKENINRKTRPIMKYVEANNTLKIEKNENVNNWEDLFDEHGQLQEDLLKEIVHKVGNDVTIVKAKEDYSDYFTKQIEELEHMVELFDFPSTFETHDLIQAFSDIKSEAMYVKWVDDTHAILVLGSLSQAQKAITIGHPLINVRPMTAASRESLATAYKHDLRPAMKRPQTNLQTARRLITSHLGTKTSISKERSAKERDDLRAAKEMKKLVKKNEQDAWEGNLRSSNTK